ncbi:MAG: substrate-binding domain-containing protein [Syntrophales bacterium]
MSEEMMNTREIADYLGIHEKQVYALVKAKKIPATRVTGKWIFPRKLIDEWIESSAREGIKEARKKSSRIKGALLASGSNDPVLDMLHTSVKQSYPDLFVFSANTGSTDGLKALNAGYTDIAWSHLYDPQSGGYNVPYLSRYLPQIKPVVVNLFYRKLGFLTAPGNPFNIGGFEDLAQKGLKFINRQPGSGTRILLDHHLHRLGITPSEIAGYEREVYTHFEVGLSILSNEADVGIATIAISRLLRLTFIPITTESFDMILSQSTYFEKGVQAFIEILQSKAFRIKTERLGDYDFHDSGKITYSEV